MKFDMIFPLHKYYDNNILYNKVNQKYIYKTTMD